MNSRSGSDFVATGSNCRRVVDNDQAALFTWFG